MTTLLELFLTFARIGLFTFGGGYGMLPLIQQEVVSRGWMDAATLVRYIGICESTPGPIAINMATFVGADRAGLAGSLCATLGVVLPSFVVILLIAAVLKGFRENRWVRAALAGIKPVVAGLILGTGAAIALNCLLPGLGDPAGTAFDGRQAFIAILVCVAAWLWRELVRKPFSPIALILFSACAGVAVYGW